MIVTAGNDPLRDDGVRYAERLEEAGVGVRHLSYPGTIHSFMLYAGALEIGLEASRRGGLRSCPTRCGRHEIQLEIAHLVRKNAWPVPPTSL